MPVFAKRSKRYASDYLVHWLMVFVVLALLTAIGLWLKGRPEFIVRHWVSSAPLHRVSKAQVDRVIQQHLEGNVFDIDVKAAQVALKQLPWVESATISRTLPDTVQIDLTEKVPVARYAHGYLVDDHGQLFEAPTDEDFLWFETDETVALDKVLPLMVQEWRAFMNILAPLKLKISRFRYEARGAQTLELDNGVTVYLGREQVKERLVRFVWVWQHVIAGKRPLPEYLDMRYKDGFALRESKPSRAESATIIPFAGSALAQ